MLVSGHLELREGGGVTFDGLTDLALDRVELHGADDAVLLRADADEEEPLERGVCAVVDDLTSGQARVTIEHLQRLRIACHKNNNNIYNTVLCNSPHNGNRIVFEASLDENRLHKRGHKPLEAI